MCMLTAVCWQSTVASQHGAWEARRHPWQHAEGQACNLSGLLLHCNPKHAAPPYDYCWELAAPLDQDAIGKGEWGGPQHVPCSRSCGGSCLRLADCCLALCQAQSFQHICARAMTVPLAISIVLHSKGQAWSREDKLGNEQYGALYAAQPALLALL